MTVEAESNHEYETISNPDQPRKPEKGNLPFPFIQLGFFFLPANQQPVFENKTKQNLEFLGLQSTFMCAKVKMIISHMQLQV